MDPGVRVSTRDGGCFCGAIRYSAEGTPTAVCICHCTSCRRASGAPMTGWATFALPQFRLIDGQLLQLGTSAGVLRGHCARCGSTLTYRHASRPTQIDLTLATLDDPSALAPTAHVWVRDKLPWVIIGDNLPRHDTVMPDD